MLTILVRSLLPRHTVSFKDGRRMMRMMKKLCSLQDDIWKIIHGILQHPWEP